MSIAIKHLSNREKQENSPRPEAAKTAELVRNVAENWTLLMFTGIVTIAAAIVATFAPLLDAGLARYVIASMLLTVGCLNTYVAVFRAEGLRIESFAVGAIQMLTAIVMAFYPFSTLKTMIIVVASLIVLEGVFRTEFAIARSNVKTWAWGLAGGVMTILLGVTAMLGLPSYGLYVIGIAVGVDLMSSGIAQVLLARAGKNASTALADAG